MMQWDQQCLCSAGTQVRSPAQHSGLKDPVLHRFQLWFGSDHQPRNSICYGVAKKEKKKKSVILGFSCPVEKTVMVD